MSARFQPDPVNKPADSMLIDPEAYDASEQEFAASLEAGRPRFVVDAQSDAVSPQPELSSPNPLISEVQESARVQTGTPVTVEAASEISQNKPDPYAWRNEVSERLDRYRSRRKPKEPRYPSLRLKFEPGEPAWSNTATVAVPEAEHSAAREPGLRVMPAAEPAPPEQPARVIPFRRSALAPPRPLDELAEPVYLAPRILEASEPLPVQPALGGILIEPEEEAAAEKRPGLEVPLQPAAMSRRLLAVGTDVMLVVIAVALFGYVFFRTTAIVPPVSQIALMTLGLAALLWPAYQYVLLVYSGATPGLKLAKLQLARFDGSAVPKRLRRWRVLATTLSGISLGLGYAWCILDEDELCWHDRITGTYMAPKSGN
jgi:uncharacterized RDD family membrane protein YckC